jgi:phosphocarrier protein HPr
LDSKRKTGHARIVNRRGLHARAAARLANLAQEFDVEITVTANGVSSSGQSIMDLMLLAAGPGDILQFEGKGNQAETAISALEFLVENGFGEDKDGIAARRVDE